MLNIINLTLLLEEAPESGSTGGLTVPILVGITMTLVIVLMRRRRK
jgi:hypothetical protein